MNITEKQIKEGMDKAYKEAGHNAYFGNGFKAGVRFVQEKANLIPVEIEMPLAYETGDWDGKRSDVVIVKTRKDEYFVARLYHGFMDGSEFNDWYSEDDFEVPEEVVAWSELPE